MKNLPPAPLYQAARVTTWALPMADLLRRFPSSKPAIIGVAVAVRLAFAAIFVDFHADYYWEYGEIAKNILHGNGYSLFYLQGNLLQHRFSPEALPFPSAWMPPGYVVFLLPFLAIPQVVFRNMCLVVSQALLAGLATWILFLFAERVFGRKTAIYCTIGYALLPEFVFAVTSFTPTILFHVAFLLLLLVASPQSGHRRRLQGTLSGAVLAGMIYLRAEFVLFALFFVINEIFSGRLRHGIGTGLLVLSLLSPWVIRNSMTFGEPAGISTNGGQNLFRGHNGFRNGHWRDDVLDEQIPHLPRSPSFEISLDSLFTARAAVWIGTHVDEVLGNLPQKGYDLWVYSTLQEERATVLYKATSVLLLATFLVGFWRSLSWKKHSLLYILFIHATIIGLVFFTLPRHQALMRIGMIPLAGLGLEILLGKRISPPEGVSHTAGGNPTKQA